MTQGVFFDFDGTIADTAPDLASATNQLLIKEGKEPLPYESLRPFVSGGSPALIKIGFGIEPEGEEFERLKEQFLAIYAECSYVDTRFFDGIEKSLDYLESKNIPWGIITNKPEFLTFPILKQMQLEERAAAIICGDTYSVKKPDPYPLVEACRIANVSPAESIYIGDDRRDIIAAKAANMLSVCAEWGYLAGQDPQDWKAEVYLQRSEELLEYLKQRCE